MEGQIKTLIIAVCLLLAGCVMTPEMRESLGAASYVIGNQWQNTMAEQRAISDYWENRQFQQDQIYQMQQMNWNLWQQNNRRY